MKLADTNSYEGPGKLVNSDKIQEPATQVKILGAMWATTQKWILKTVKRKELWRSTTRKAVSQLHHSGIGNNVYLINVCIC